MSWLELDDRILEHPKFIRAVNIAGSGAVHLWLGLRAYCGQLLTDGYVPGDMLMEVRGPNGLKARQHALVALSAAGLVEILPDGRIQLHDYLQWSKSREQVLELREKARARKARSRRDSQCDSAVTPRGVTNPRARVLHSSPLLSTPSEEGAHAPEEELSSGVLELPDEQPSPTSCPLTLNQQAKAMGVIAAFCDRYAVEPEQLQSAIDEFVSYWTIGGGMGRKHTNWLRKLREHLRRTCERPGGLKPIGELEHEQHEAGGALAKHRAETELLKKLGAIG